MSGAGVRNPFRPGHGGAPPYLAGREPEQALFREVSDDLRSGVPVARLLVVYGPRGNGKTALLRWAKREADADDGLDARWLVGSDIPAPGDFVAWLGPGSWLRKIAPESVSVAGIGVSLRGGGDRPLLLAEALEARAKAKPLLILLDEAHTLKPEVGQWLLNAAQTAGRRAPFLLVLAGTPDLAARLSEMEASFWNRAEEVPLGRLDEGAAGEAIRRPLAEDGIGVEEEALARMVGESHGYPFFVQLWGRAAWARARGAGGGAGPVTTAAVEEAAGEFEIRRNRYYLRRYRELEERELLPAARAVAAAFPEEGLLSHAAFRRAVARSGGGGPGIVEAAEALEHLGFVWQAKGTLSWEPGIPSLMDFILENAPRPDDEEAGGG